MATRKPTAKRPTKPKKKSLVGSLRSKSKVKKKASKKVTLKEETKRLEKQKRQRDKKNAARRKKYAAEKAAQEKRNAQRRKKYAQKKKLKDALRKQKEAVPASIQTVLQPKKDKRSGTIVTSEEIIRLKLIEGLEKASQSGKFPIPYDDGMLWHSIEPTEGYHMAVHLNMMFNTENEEEIIYRMMKAARRVNAASKSTDFIYSSMWFFEYGSNIIGSHKPSMFISPDGEIAETAQGTKGIQGLAAFEQRLRNKISDLIDNATRNAVFIRYATVRTYTPKEEN